MKHLHSTLAAGAILTALASAQSNSEPRVPATLPLMSSAKLPAVSVEPAPAPARIEPTATPAPIAKPFDAARHATQRAPIDRLCFATEADGTIWVRGRTYKASFGSGGATYVPFLGSDAPRNFPLDLSLASASIDDAEVELAPATSAMRDGDRVVIHRGPVDEVYELGLESVEQTFVVTEKPAIGSLKLVVGLRSDMQRNATADGLEFSNELGSVRYGQAFVREASGTRVPVESRMTADGIEIEVPASYVATAQFPLVVDPVISTFAVDLNANHVESDVAYDVSNDRFLVAYEEIFSATDGDVWAQLRDGAGNYWYGDYLDISTENWRSPQCANLNRYDQFLCVAQCSNVVGAAGSVIRGVTVSAATFQNGFKFNISTPEQTGDKILGDVGGDPYDGPSASYYCVVWQRNYAVGDTDIHARLVTPQSTLVGPGTILIDNSGSSLDAWPSISKSDGMSSGASAWTIAWHRAYSSTEHDIFAARLRWDGVIVDPSVPIHNLSGLDYYPRASSPLDDGRSLVVYAHYNGVDHDLMYVLLSGTSAVAFGNLSALDTTNTLGEQQVEYSVDSDGARFVVAYCESYVGSNFDYDVWISAFAPFGTGLAVTEARASLDYTTQQSFRSDVVAMHSGGAVSSRFYASWDSTPTGVDHDIYGAIYDRPIGGGYQRFCAGDGSQTACPCGNNGSFGRGCANSFNATGAALNANGNAQTGAGDNLSFEVDGVPPGVPSTLFQGTLFTSPVSFGDGLRCVNGTQIRIRTKPADASGNATWPTAGESPISVTGLIPLAGATRFYQVTYRNAANFCTTATFNISSGMRVLWLP